MNGCADKNEPKDVKTISAGQNWGKKGDLKAIVTKYDCKPSLPVQGVMVMDGNHKVAKYVDGISKFEYIFNWFLALRENL